MLGLKDHCLKRHNGVKWQTPALAAVSIHKAFDQPAAEILESHRLIQSLKRVAILAQGFKVIVQAKQKFGSMMACPSMMTSKTYHQMPGLNT
jgi:hypothetical protein